MNNAYSDLKEYVRTFFWTLFVAIVVVTILVVDLRLNVGNKKDNEYHIKVLTNVSMSLDELYYLEKQNPNDYMINLKIAFLFEVLKDSVNAQINYKKALDKSNNTPFAVYKTAMFFINQKKYTEAINMAELLPDYNNKNIFELKARFYSKLANSFLDDGDFVNSVKVYKIALKYAKNTDSELEKIVRIDFAAAYNKYAEKYINENDLRHAIQMLQNALEVYPDPYAMYKLGLIYENVDDEKAQKYMEEAYRINPRIVNPDIYNRLLEKLVKNNTAAAEYSKARFYSLKQDNFKRKFINTNIFEGDVELQNLKIITKRAGLIGKKHFYIDFDLKNKSSYTIDNMFIKFVIQPHGGKSFETEEKIITRNNPINPQKTLHNIRIELDYNDVDVFSKYAQIQIFARKDIRSPWVMIDFLTASFIK